MTQLSELEKTSASRSLNCHIFIPAVIQKHLVLLKPEPSESSAVQIRRFPGSLFLLLQNPSSQVVQLLLFDHPEALQHPKCLLSPLLFSLWLYQFSLKKCTLMPFYWDFRQEQRLLHAINAPSFTRSQSDVL